MNNYTLTAFDKTGKKLLDEGFTAQNDEDAKGLAENKLDELGFSEMAHRCVSADARLVSFHR